MADYTRNDDVRPVYVTPMTPREREFDRRIKDLENVVSKLAKAVFYDDSMTLAGPVTLVTNTTNVPEPVPTADQHKVALLEEANEALRNEIIKKDKEIVRLSELNYSLDSRLDDYHDSFIAIRNAVDELGDDW